MTETLISYDAAVLAKEKKFDIKTTCVYYHNSILFENGTLVDFLNPVNQYQLFDLRKGKNFKISNPFVYAPTQSLLQKFLREKHNLHIDISININSLWYFSVYDLSKKRNSEVPQIHDNYDKITYDSYEQALEIALFESLKLIKL